MKNISAILIIVCLVGCSAIISRNVSNHSLQEINIPTAQCGMCVARIDKVLNGIDGILKYKIELSDLKVKVKYDNKLAMCCRLPKDRR